MPILSTIKQAGDVLELFSRQHPEWGVREVARALEIPKSNAHQLLASLETIGFLHRMVTGRYRLGFRLLTLGQYLMANTPWRDVAHRVLVQASANLGETVQLAVLDGGRLIYVDKVLGSNAGAIQSPHSNPGHAVAPFSSALGRVLLASKPWRTVQGVLERQGGGGTKPEVFRNELAAIARGGFALDLERSRPGVCCVAAPVRNHNGDVIAAISVSIASKRRAGVPDGFRDAIVERAANLSRAIGFAEEWVPENRRQSRLARGRVG